MKQQRNGGDGGGNPQPLTRKQLKGREESVSLGRLAKGKKGDVVIKTTNQREGKSHAK